MKNKIFLNNILFRILTPVLYGPIVYILILLVFDSLSQLSDNFLSTEVLVLILITGILFESLRGLNIIVEKVIINSKKLYIRVISHLLSTIGLSIIVVSILVYIYFTYIEGFSSFNTELITFNSVFILSSLLYELIYLSFYLLSRQNTNKLEHETFLRQSLELELKTYKNDINPDLLFGSFEAIISLLKASTTNADNLIVNLSSFYRYCLLNRNNEIVLISSELKALCDFLSILNYRYSNKIKFNNKIDPNYLNRAIVPCSVLIIIEYCVSENIINHLQGLEITAQCEDEYLIISYDINKKIKGNDFDLLKIKKLKEAYTYYSNKTIEFIEDDVRKRIQIPLLIIDE